MSALQEMLDRLSGVSALRDRMNDLHATLRDHQHFILEHERRLARLEAVGSSRVDLQACKLEYSIVSPK